MATIIIVKISFDDVSRCDTSHIERALHKIEQNPERVRESQGAYTFTFEEFEDVEGLYLIPEVKCFLRKAHSQVQHLFYYLWTNPEVGNLFGFLAAHASEELISVTDGKADIHFDQSDASVDLLSILIDRLVATAKFAARMADDGLAIISRVLEPLGMDYQQVIVDQVMDALNT